MIKIEFKEGLKSDDGFGRKFMFAKEIVSAGITFCSVMFINGNTMFLYKSNIISVNDYIPTQDPMLDRSEILKQLGISQKEDEQNQIKWSKLI